MRGRALVVLLALASLLAVVSPSLEPFPSPYPLLGGERGELGGTVGRIVDGDTIYVRLTTGVEKVRYIGVDTPEVHHPTRGEEPGGREATEVNRRLLGDHPVRLETDVQLRDRYGPKGAKKLTRKDLAIAYHHDLDTKVAGCQDGALNRRLQIARAAQLMLVVESQSYDVATLHPGDFVVEVPGCCG